MVKELKSFNYRHIHDQVRELRESIINLLDRELRPSSELQVHFHITLLALVRQCKNLFRGAMTLMVDGRVAEGLDEETCLAAVPLVRSMVDGLLTLLYLLDDPRNRMTPFMKSGWAEVVVDRNRAVAELPGVPEVEEYAKNLDRMIDSGRAALQITPKEEANLKKMKRLWPNPSRMATEYRETTVTAVGELIVRVVDLFYARMSEETHFSFYGLIRLGSFYTKESAEEKDLELQIQITIQVTSLLSALLLMSSVIDEFCDFGLAERIDRIWILLAELSPFAAKLREVRFKTTPLLPLKFSDLA